MTTEKLNRMAYVITEGFAIAKKHGFKGDICEYTALVTPPIEMYKPETNVETVPKDEV